MVSPEASFINPAVLDAQAIRQAGADLLSLALMDARNRTLGWLTVFDGLDWRDGSDEVDPPVWLAGHAGWFQERWLARQVQRGRGARADRSGPRLASIEPWADAWFDPQSRSRADRWQHEWASGMVRDYLAATLETTLELLDKATASDDGLYMHRLVLAHEDRIGEALAACAQVLDLPAERGQQAIAQGLWPGLPSRARREPLWLGGQAWQLGSPDRGWSPEAERPAHTVPVEAFEIDAQPVSWGQFAEFIDDSGYDDRGLWTDSGWDWLNGRLGDRRRAPRHVAQANGGILAQRLGRLQRLPSAQSALHVTAHEAQAWCRWAGRRLPTEAEWELAACNAGSRGFAWGDGLEWVLGAAGPYPGAPAAPSLLDAFPGTGGAGAGQSPGRVLRGGSAFGSSRLCHPRARRYAAAGDDTLFTGFRSCAA